MDILVMENIFYNRDLFPIYDLKGSERARLARDNPSDPARVLLDQNLMQSNLNDPILVRLHAHCMRIYMVSLVDDILSSFDLRQ